MNDTDLLRRAYAAYFRGQKNWTYRSDQPNSGLSEVRKYKRLAYVVLKNVRGTLAVYRVKKDGALRGLKQWPNALDD
jgi:hypothetical protein